MLLKTKNDNRNKNLARRCLHLSSLVCLHTVVKSIMNQNQETTCCGIYPRLDRRLLIRRSFVGLVRRLTLRDIVLVLKPLLLFRGRVIVSCVYSFVCLVCFLPEVEGWPTAARAFVECVFLSLKFVSLFGRPLESCDLIPFIPQLLEYFSSAPAKPRNYVLLELAHAFLQFRILAHSWRKRPLKAMKE